MEKFMQVTTGYSFTSDKLINVVKVFITNHKVMQNDSKYKLLLTLN